MLHCPADIYCCQGQQGLVADSCHLSVSILPQDLQVVAHQTLQSSNGVSCLTRHPVDCKITLQELALVALLVAIVVGSGGKRGWQQGTLHPWQVTKQSQTRLAGASLIGP